MQSLYNVIKKSSIIKEGKKHIVTEFKPLVKEETTIQENKQEVKDDSKDFMESYEKLVKNMLITYRKKGERIISKAYEEASKIEEEAYKNAYENGYNEGQDNGYKDGYKESYEDNIEKAMEESEKIIKKAQDTADNIIKSAKKEYIKYVECKRVKIIEMIENIVEQVFKTKIQEKDGLNEMVLEIVSEAKNSKTIVIKCNNIYKEEIEKAIKSWESGTIFKGDIFVLEDNSLKDGKVFIEKDNGKTIIDIDKSLDKIKKILQFKE